MAKLDGLKTVLDFLKGLQPKIAAQIAKKVLALNVDPAIVVCDMNELNRPPCRTIAGNGRVIPPRPGIDHRQEWNQPNPRYC